MFFINIYTNKFIFVYNTNIISYYKSGYHIYIKKTWYMIYVLNEKEYIDCECMLIKLCLLCMHVVVLC